MKGDAYDPKLKPKKLNKKEKEKAAKQKEKLFAWIPDKMKVKHNSIVIGASLGIYIVINKVLYMGFLCFYVWRFKKTQTFEQRFFMYLDYLNILIQKLAI